MYNYWKVSGETPLFHVVTVSRLEAKELYCHRGSVAFGRVIALDCSDTRLI